MSRPVVRLCASLILLLVGLGVLLPSVVARAAGVKAVAAQGANPEPGSVQLFLDRQPGVLRQYHDGGRSAANIIESYAAYYSLNPHILLTLLEVGPALLSDTAPPAAALERPFGTLGPEGFTAQIDWATREVRAGFGPYTSDPAVTFTDGPSETISRQQDPAIMAVQRFLAQGRTREQWHTVVDRFMLLYRSYFGDESLTPTPTATPRASRGFLGLPWPAGTRMIHASYFDHVYPTVDKGSDGNNFIVTYLGTSNVSYNSHDGHDFYFPDKPIGTPILAAAPGIAYAFSTPGNGVVVRHGGAYAGYETVYWHLDQFDIKFKGKIDNQVGVAVQAGEVLGVSGKSGFTDGGAHLHFEVRHNGLEVDPYGWFGGGADPCAAWTAGCEASVWLWRDSLLGTYDFTPPNSSARPDTEPPVGTVSVVQHADLGLLVHFDGHPVPSIGVGFPEMTATNGESLHYVDGVFGQAVSLPSALNLTYPVAGNLSPAAGTITVWANVPHSFAHTSTDHHYLFAASENPGDASHGVYTNTLALRHEITAGLPEWNFWTVDAQGRSQNLVITDTLQPGWHHFAVSWDTGGRAKRLVIDGSRVAEATDVVLPEAVGDRFEVGRWTAGYGDAGIALDELAIWKRVLPRSDLSDLAAKRDIGRSASGAIDSVPVVASRDVVLDTNAIDARGGIVSVQLKRDNEPWGEPLPYFDSYRWSITGTAGLHTFAVRYTDGSNNTAIVTTTVRLAAAPRGEVRVKADNPFLATMSFAVTSETPDVMVEVGASPDLLDSAWQPLAPSQAWTWTPGLPQIAYVRFRDANGLMSDVIPVGPDLRQTFVPLAGW